MRGPVARYLNEIKESVNSGLLWASKQGPIAEENILGCGIGSDHVAAASAPAKSRPHHARC